MLQLKSGDLIVSRLVKFKLPVLLILLEFLLAYPLHSQKIRSLTLEQAISIARKKSYRMQTLYENLESAKENLKAAQGQFRTNAHLNLSSPDFRQQVSEIPVPNGLPVYNTTGTLLYQSNLTINQPLPTNGFFSLRSSLFQEQVSTYVALNQQTFKRKDFYTSVSLQFQQPLFTLNTLKVGLKKAKLNYETARLRYKQETANMVYNVTQGFYNLYQAERLLEIAKEEVKERQDAYELAQNKFKAGLIPEVEAMQLGVDLAQSKNNLMVARGNYQRLSDSFKQLIGLSLDEPIRLVPNLGYKEIQITLADAVSRALKNRPEIQQQKIQVEMAKIHIREVDSQSEVKGMFSAYYNLTGISDPSLPFSSRPYDLFQSSTADMKTRPKNKGISFTLSIPLWDWGVNRAQVNSAKAALIMAELDQKDQEISIRRQIRALVGRVQEALDRLKILDKNREVARKSFHISLARFDNGEITSQELARVQDQLSQAEINYLSAFIAYKLALADLERNTLYNYEEEK